MGKQRPLILFTNDDGIDSPGLWAVAKAFADIADLLIVAPREQQSGMGRSLPIFSEGRIYPYDKAPLNGNSVFTAYAVDGTPAQSVQHGVLELADRKPSLVISGINYGENTGNSVTISGTVGAAIEASSLGIPAIAVSMQMSQEYHLTHDKNVDFSAGAYFTRKFGEQFIGFDVLTDDIDLLKLEIPWGATPKTDWRITRLSRQRVFWPTKPDRTEFDQIGKLGYHFNIDTSLAEPDSDVYAIHEDGVVSLTPMSLDMTSRIDRSALGTMLMGETETTPIK